MSGSLRPAFQPTEVALGVGPRAPGLGEVEDRFDTETEIEADGGSAFRLGDMEGALMHWRSGERMTTPRASWSNRSPPTASSEAQLGTVASYFQRCQAA